MTSPNLQRRYRKTLTYVLVVSALAGAIYGGVLTYILAHGEPHELLEDIVRGTLRGIFTGLMIGGLIGWFDIFLVNTGRARLRSLPFLWLVLIKGAYYSAAILGSIWLGGHLFRIEGDPGTGFNRTTIITVTFALIFSTLFSFMMEMSLLLGPGVLRDMLLGRYHHPRRERRLFVFFDMRGSTAIAERIGDLAFHRLLNRFFSDLTEPVLAWQGVIHKYVGDSMIVTWPLGGGRNPAGAFAAVAEAHARLASLRDDYLRDFGMAPEFRAVLHAGEVVTGEMGEVKREIVLLGDTINTTARIEQLAKTMPDHATIASAEALAAALPAGTAARPLGEFSLPGKSAAITLYAVS
ncbi:MAG: adenylate/guanylate cyclase domain-containing protein [Ferrovibrio sp.]|uniref:adenylate/guanylate cyclase domain-containing protein n=1 Tax=Ferrovibrio sp. TaxID=1917215 RepID=UPI003919B57F